MHYKEHSIAHYKDINLLMSGNIRHCIESLLSRTDVLDAMVMEYPSMFGNIADTRYVAPAVVTFAAGLQSYGQVNFSVSSQTSIIMTAIARAITSPLPITQELMSAGQILLSYMFSYVSNIDTMLQNQGAETRNATLTLGKKLVRIVSESIGPGFPGTIFNNYYLFSLQRADALDITSYLNSILQFNTQLRQLLMRSASQYWLPYIIPSILDNSNYQQMQNILDVIVSMIEKYNRDIAVKGPVSPAREPHSMVVAVDCYGP